LPHGDPQLFGRRRRVYHGRMTRNRSSNAIALPLLMAALASCADLDADVEPAVAAVVAGGAAKGAIPAGLPARELVGLFEDTGATWMKSSGVAWDVRYRYFTKGWVNNWGFGAYDGSWGLGYMRECDGQRFIPAVQYYQMNGEAGGGESAFLQKAQNATTMKSYFGDFKILMQRAKDFGKPVIVLIEADGFGFLQQQTGSNSGAYAAIKDSGVAELAGLPNTVAGWGLAFLQLKKSVGAGNAILGIHISGWASGKDIATDPSPIRCRQKSTRSTTFSRRLAWRPTSRAPPGTCWSAIRWTAIPTTTCSCRGRTAGGTPATRRRSIRRASTATRSGCGCGT